jgi:hypothetical protein
MENQPLFLPEDPEWMENGVLVSMGDWKNCFDFDR